MSAFLYEQNDPQGLPKQEPVKTLQKDYILIKSTYGKTTMKKLVVSKYKYPL